MVAILPGIGSTEFVVLLFAAGFWLGVGAFVAIVARRFFRKPEQDRATATLVEENRRLRQALAERRSG